MKLQLTRLLGCVAVAALSLSVLSSTASAAPATARPVTAAGSTQAPAAAPAVKAHPQHKTARVCGTPRAHSATCFAIRQTDTVEPAALSAQAITPAAVPAGYGPANLRSAYNLTASGSSSAVVAIVDAYDDPSAEADLGTYRAQYGLPACTTANGCFRKVNGNGAASPLPAANTGWAGEISLDVDMVSAICPNCHILLVEASGATNSGLYTAEDTAVALGAKFISNSWGGAESSTQTSDDAHFNHPGVAITASSGDDGAGASYPATSQYVTAVGGTSLSAASTARGWAETAWSGAGSGCSAYDPKPSFQASVATSCARRAESDVSAVADPNTGVAVYQTYGGSGWAVYGGTSAAAPVIASVYALAGTPSSSTYANSYPYAHTSSLNDVTSGTNGTCGATVFRNGRLGRPDRTGHTKRDRSLHRFQRRHHWCHGHQSGSQDRQGRHRLLADVVRQRRDRQLHVVGHRIAGGPDHQLRRGHLRNAHGGRILHRDDQGDVGLVIGHRVVRADGQRRRRLRRHPAAGQPRLRNRFCRTVDHVDGRGQR